MAMAGVEGLLLRLAQGYQLSQALYVAPALELADVLAAEALNAGALASAVGAEPPELRRVLRALVAAGVFTELEDGRFALNDAAAGLRANAPGRTRDVVINFGEEMYRAFGELLHTVRTGQTAFEAVFGQPLFDYYGSHPAAEASGSARMEARSLPVARELAASGLVRGAKTVVDVGGGKGTMLAALLQPHPGLRGVLCERPPVLALARGYLAAHGVAGRCELVPGDFFASVPRGGDLYLLKSVLHDWDDGRCVMILRNCRAAMHPAARLAIVEFVLPQTMTADPALLPAALLDLIMLAYAGGRERTESEFADLLGQAKLHLDRVTPLQSGPRVLTAVPA
jgi:O-methyltransferase domain/Dimerisation domain